MRAIDSAPTGGSSTSMPAPPSAAVQRRSFQSLFCERYQCPVTEFESQLFTKSLYRHARPFARIVAWCVPEFFREDAGFIRDLASTSSRAEVLTELNRFYGRNVRDRNWLRKHCRIRVSGKRIQRLARSLFVAEAKARRRRQAEARRQTT